VFAVFECSLFMRSEFLPERARDRLTKIGCRFQRK
jgi:hypothetical protein